MSNFICMGLAVSSIIIAGVALPMACVCWAKVVGMEKSTHQIQYVPIDDSSLTGEKLEENIRKAMGEEQIEREYV